MKKFFNQEDCSGEGPAIEVTSEDILELLSNSIPTSLVALSIDDCMTILDVANTEMNIENLTKLLYHSDIPFEIVKPQGWYTMIKSLEVTVPKVDCRKFYAILNKAIELGAITVYEE